MSEQEYSIPKTVYAELTSDVIIDIPKGREGLDPHSVGVAREAVSRTFADIVTPERIQQIESIVLIGTMIAMARKYREDSEFVMPYESQNARKNDVDLAA